MQEKRRLQRLGQHIAPENGPVERVQVAGVFQREEGEGDQAEQIKVGSAGGGPAAKEHVDAHGQVNESNDTLRLGEAPIPRLGDDDDGGVKGNAATGDGVGRFAVNFGAVENALQIGYPHDGDVIDLGKQLFRLDVGALGWSLRQGLDTGKQFGGLSGGGLGGTFRQDLGPGEEVIYLDAFALSGTVWEHLFGDEAHASGGFAPPDAVVRLLELGLLAEIQDGKQDEACRGHGQHDRLQTVEEVGIHGGRSTSSSFVARGLPCGRNELVTMVRIAID